MLSIYLDKHSYKCIEPIRKMVEEEQLFNCNFIWGDFEIKLDSDNMTYIDCGEDENNYLAIKILYEIRNIVDERI